MSRYTRMYVVQCLSYNHFYVGSTCREMWGGHRPGGPRVDEHKSAYGCKFTQRYGFGRILFVCFIHPNKCSQLESDLTRVLMHRYGIECVRGGDYTNMRKDCMERKFWMPLEFQNDPLRPGLLPESRYPDDLRRLVLQFDTALHLKGKR